MTHTTIFVFGSNLAGRHGKGSALEAYVHWGAQRGVGEGIQGNAYAIPTKDARLKPLPLEVIATHVARFLEFAEAHRVFQFKVVKIGCGLAGFTEEQIAPMFRLAPTNVDLPENWRLP